jgi:hypothetical protein
MGHSSPTARRIESCLSEEEEAFAPYAPGIASNKSTEAGRERQHQIESSLPKQKAIFLCGKRPSKFPAR